MPSHSDSALAEGQLDLDEFVREAQWEFGEVFLSLKGVWPSKGNCMLCYKGWPSGFIAVVCTTGALGEIAWSDAEVISCLYYPSFDVKDLTGDSVPEIILRGMAGARGNWAGSILMYRNDRIEAVNPTETINGRVCSSLTGYWTYKDLDGDGVLDIQGQETEAGPDPARREYTIRYSNRSERFESVTVQGNARDR